MARLIQKGDILDWTNGGAAAVTAGTVVVAGTFVGVVQNDIPVGELGAIAITGIWEVAKTTGAIDAGDPVYWSASNGYATGTASGSVFMGRAVADAASGDATIRVRLEAPGDAAYANA